MGQPSYAPRCHERKFPVKMVAAYAGSRIGCSTLINLGHDLLECYQRLDDLNPFSFAARSDLSTHLANLNLVISHHSETCPVCRRRDFLIDETPEMAVLVESSPEIPPNGWFG